MLDLGQVGFWGNWILGSRIWELGFWGIVRKSGFGETVILEKVGFWYIGILQGWDFGKVGF